MLFYPFIHTPKDLLLLRLLISPPILINLSIISYLLYGTFFRRYYPSIHPPAHISLIVETIHFFRVNIRLLLLSFKPCRCRLGIYKIRVS
jgi:hypothetical protein